MNNTTTCGLSQEKVQWSVEQHGVLLVDGLCQNWKVVNGVRERCGCSLGEHHSEITTGIISIT